jgi:hypothetical protein
LLWHDLKKKNSVQIGKGNGKNENPSSSFFFGSCKLLSGYYTDENLFGASVLGDSLGTFGDGVLGKFTREDKTNSGLDLARRDGRTLVVSSQLGSFGSNTLKDIVNERVQNGHGLVRDTSIGVNLLQDLVNVRGVSLTTGDLSLLVVLGGSLLVIFGREISSHFSYK